MHIGLISGSAFVTTGKPVPFSYPDYVAEHALYHELCKRHTVSLIVLDQELKELEAEWPRDLVDLDLDMQRKALVEEVDLLFVTQVNFNKKNGELYLPKLTRLIKDSGKPVIYRSGDNEVAEFLAKKFPYPRQNIYRYLQDYENLVVLTQNSAVTDASAGIFYLPSHYSEEVAAYVRSRTSSGAKSYLVSLFGGLTGREYYLDVLSDLSAQYHLPPNMNCYHFDNMKMKDYGLNWVTVDLSAGDNTLTELAGFIGESLFQIHGGSWFAPRGRPAIDRTKPPPYSVFKLFEHLYSPESTVLLTLDCPEISCLQKFPRELIINYPLGGPTPWSEIDYLELIEATNLASSLLSRYNVVNWLDFVNQATALKLGIKLF